MPDQIPIQVFADDSRIAALTAYTERLEELVAVHTDAMAGDADLLDRAPGVGAWSVTQVLHHLADYELRHSAALRAILVEDEPALPGWDPDRHADVLQYEVRPPADALTVILSLRQLNSRLLACQPPAAWARVATTAEGDRVDLAAVVLAAADHLAEHVLQARRAVIGMV
ncbi:MAG TPA: DinB family protein [Candidatus Nanopelagicales bacterium]|nr:DinB family protein [Candidatus Nanopelagicales bacterium]